MSKQQMKAKKIVSGAVNTFSKAITEVEKANALLTLGVLADEKELESISKQVVDLYTKLDIVQANKMNKKSEIIQNKELITKFEHFTK